MRISIVGLGYVGLPLALQFARNGVEVTDLDVDESIVGALNEGRSYIRQTDSMPFATEVQAGRFRASADFPDPLLAGAVVICVSAPLNKR